MAKTAAASKLTLYSLASAEQFVNNEDDRARAGGFDVVMTDPPYTVPGAELFLSRAVAALAPQPGRHIFFSFGARKPEETAAVQLAIAQLGLAVRSLTPNFNEYLGAGVLGGTSHLYHLPGMFAYDRAKPDRCYAEEAAAVADGFTKAKR